MSKSMRCPSCGHHESLVPSTDPFDTVIKRVRKCVKCGWSWSTTEIIDEQGKPMFLYGTPPSQK